MLVQWKQAARSLPPAPIDRHKNYGPAEVATILDTSYDTALRRMAKMKGCLDMGSKKKRYRRRKRMLRIPGSALLEYLRNHLA